MEVTLTIYDKFTCLKVMRKCLPVITIDPYMNLAIFVSLVAIIINSTKMPQKNNNNVEGPFFQGPSVSQYGDLSLALKLEWRKLVEARLRSVLVSRKRLPLLPLDLY